VLHLDSLFRSDQRNPNHRSNSGASSLGMNNRGFKFQRGMLMLILEALPDSHHLIQEGFPSEPERIAVILDTPVKLQNGPFLLLQSKQREKREAQCHAQ